MSIQGSMNRGINIASFLYQQTPEYEASQSLKNFKARTEEEIKNWDTNSERLNRELDIRGKSDAELEDMMLSEAVLKKNKEYGENIDKVAKAKEEIDKKNLSKRQMDKVNALFENAADSWARHQMLTDKYGERMTYLDNRRDIRRAVSEVDKMAAESAMQAQKRVSGWKSRMEAARQAFNASPNDLEAYDNYINAIDEQEEDK